MQAINTMRTKRSRRGLGILAALALIAALLTTALIIRATDEAGQGAPRAISQSQPSVGTRDLAEILEFKHAMALENQAAPPAGHVGAATGGNATIGGYDGSFCADDDPPPVFICNKPLH